jgi:curved DNA-binding protein CbpA
MREPDLAVWLRVLGLEYPSSLTEATKAFRALARRYHPDLGGDPAAFARVKQAYDRIRELLGAAA